VRRVPATAKINLALVVGPRRPDGKHEVATVLQRVDLTDRIALEQNSRLEVRGFPDDTLVRDALTALAEAAGVAPAWAVRIDKRIPVAAGLGGGSSDAASALRLANETLADPLPPEALAELAAGLGVDVPFFLTKGPQLGEGDGSWLSPLDLPQDYFVLLVLPRGAAKASTAAVYDAFDGRGGPAGFETRLARLRETLADVERPRDLAALPPNDLASSPLTDELRDLGAFRADVSGAGPAVYGLFVRRDAAERARAAIARRGRTWLTVPAWYG
jgi:4-diphosphocytidyl-2-C-methyl-D-erythritol kinase